MRITIYLTVYSDEECEKQDKRMKTDEELFYDPGADDKDEQWVQNKRKNYLAPGMCLFRGGMSRLFEYLFTTYTVHT